MAFLFGSGQKNISTTENKLSAVQIQNSSQGVPIPIVYGKTRIAGNSIWYGDFVAIPHTDTQSGGGGKGGGGSGSVSTTSYTYTTGVAIALCEGPITGYGTVWESKSITTTSALGLTEFLGSYSQTAWSYLTSNHPSDAFGYRGQAYVATAAFDLGISNSLPNLSFEIKGLLYSSTTYDVVLSQVLHDVLTSSKYGAGFPSAQIDDLTPFFTYCKAAGFRVSPAYVTQKPAADLVTELALVSNSAPLWSEGLLKIVPYGGELLATSGNITFSGGNTIHTYTASTLLICPDSLNVSVLAVAGGGGGGDGSTGGGGGGGAGGMLTGNATLSSFMPVVVGAGGASDTNGEDSAFASYAPTGGGAGGAPTITGANGGSGGGSGVQSNGTHSTGVSGQGHAGGASTATGGFYPGSGGGGAGHVGFDAASSDTGAAGGDGLQSSISGTATYYAGGGAGGQLSGGFTHGGGRGGGGAHGDPGTDGLGGGGAGGYHGNAGGKGGSGVVVVSYPTSSDLGYVSLTDDDFIAPIGEDPVKVTRKRQADAYNSVTVECLDRDNGYNIYVAEAKDQWNIDVYGLRPMPVVTAHMICTRALGRQVAQNILERVLYIRNTYEFTIGLRFARLEPMDVVSLTDSGLGLNAQPVRIVSVEEDQDLNLKIVAEDFLTSGVNSGIYDTQGTNGYVVNQNASGGNTSTPVIFQPPIELTASPQIWIGAAGGNQWGGCEVWVSSDAATYTKLGMLTAPARYGTLTANLPAGANPDLANTLSVDLTVSGGVLTSVPQDQANALATLSYVGGELVAYQTANLTSPYNYSLTYLPRGEYGSAINTHLTGETFMRLDNAVGAFDLDLTWVGITLYAKFPSFNKTGGGLQSIADVPAVTYVVQSTGIVVPNGAVPSVIPLGQYYYIGPKVQAGLQTRMTIYGRLIDYGRLVVY